jgi:polyhydroxybutyrate depolymerase
MRGVVVGVAAGLTAASSFAQQAPAEQRGFASGALDAGGVQRTYVVYQPEALEPGQRVPLVLSFHGAGSYGQSQADVDAMTEAADAHRWIVAYPDGIGLSWNDGRGTMPAERRGVDDVAFVSALIDHLAASLPVDPERVYAMGFSSGGMLTHRLACESAGRVRAIASVAGTMAEAIAGRCAPSRPVSVIMFHGTEDAVAPYKGGRTGRWLSGPALSFEENTRRWAAWNGCAGEPDNAELPDAADDHTAVRVLRHAGCRGGVEVHAYTVAHGGHTWPGAPEAMAKWFPGRTSYDVQASRLIADFFARTAGR